MGAKTNIDNEQADTINEHFEMIMRDETFFDSKYTKVTANDLPIWFDEHLFRKGQDYFHDNLLSLLLSYVTGTISVLAIPSISKVLMSTGSSSTPCSAYKRFFTTEILIIDLHGDDVTNSESKFYKSINTARYMHAMVCERAQRNKRDGIKQKDLVLGLHAFTAYTLSKPTDFGLRGEKGEREAYNHFWRVIGHLIGIPDRLNICRKNEYETTLLCEKIFNEYVYEHIKNANPDFFILANKAIQGLQAFDPTSDTDAYLTFFHEINGIPYHTKMSWYSKVIYWYKKGVVISFRLPIIGGISRIFWNKFIQLLVWLGLNYPVFAWLKFGKQNSEFELYPHSI